MPPPAPSTYTPPPPPPPVEAPAPAPAPVVKQSNAGPYISGAVGLGLPEDLKVPTNEEQFDAYYPSDFKVKMDSGIALTGALGYNFNPVRLEAEVGYHNHDVSNGQDADGSLSLLTVMANAYYDIDAGSGVKPYLMGGAGWGHTRAKEPSQTITDDVFVWQVGAGVGVAVADNTTLDLGYRYVKPDDFSVGGGDKAQWAIHNIMLGLRYQF
ncbi:outer membrane beta-barrel protein [Chlorobaculum sp. MV4-Y]|uniref:outer membrane protein n=1 Tax=Chlorobaculum sp. MV4-Y TaxID=2976335 RepID=UPI0021AF110B|nr:outer membrane beta-barrel protein [Chlorobaculum sp. MV4-Y]UWX58795.1 outer membrane beta-barrel protein [Chlorobaculum sp. MV4-Y]